MLVGAAGKNRALLLQVKKKKKERGFPSAPRRLAPHEAWRRAPNQYPRPPLVPPCMSHPDLLPSPTLFSVSWTSIAQFPAPVCVGWLPWPVTSGSVRDFFFFRQKKRGEVSHRPEDGAWRRGLCQGLTYSRHPLVDRFVGGYRAWDGPARAKLQAWNRQECRPGAGRAGGQSKRKRR